jgi:hypothetical protein
MFALIAFVLTANFVALSVGVITTLGLVAVAVIQNRGLKVKANQAVDKAEEAVKATVEVVGQPNGKGNVVQMLELLVDRVDDIAVRQEQGGVAILAVLDDLGDVRERMSYLEGTLGMDHRPNAQKPPSRAAST